MYVKIYANTGGSKPRNLIALFGCAGLQDWVSTDTNAPVYAIETMGVYLYAVIGSDVYQIDTEGVTTNVGTIPLTHNKVRLSVNNNGNELVILTSSGRSWIYDEDADTLTEIPVSDYQLSSDVTSIDGYTVFSKQNSDQFFPSDVRDATSYDPLDFQTAEGEPDILIATRKFQSGIWNFGEKTLEFYQNVGGNPIFQRVNQASRGVGCYARDSVAQTSDGNFIFWLGNNRKIYKGSGYDFKKISTNPLDEELETYSDLDLQNAEAFCYTIEGHDFYNITFPDQDKTFSYDVQTQLWHQRESFDSETSQTTRWRASCFADFGGRRIVGDYKNGKLYYLDNTYNKEGDNPLIAKIISTPLFNGMIRTIINSFYLDMETGIGATSGQGNNPKLMFQYSRDGGRTYSQELHFPLGELGKYREVVKITPIGLADNFTFKFKISDPIKRRIYAGYIEFKEGHP
jgi:hypothetical protein